MAKYRPVYVKIWNDPNFQDYSPIKKLLFVYLCTNASTTESGIYPLTFKTISRETGIPGKTISKLLNGKDLKNVSYDRKNNVVFVHNFLEYGGGGNPELLRISILNDFETTEESKKLWKKFVMLYHTHPRIWQAVETVGKQLANSSKTLFTSRDKEVKDSKESKLSKLIGQLSTSQKDFVKTLQDTPEFTGKKKTVHNYIMKCIEDNKREKSK